MIRSHKLEGIVIKRINYGEVDKIITIFSLTNGKMVLLARGIRKIHSRKAPHLELFNHCLLTVVDGKSLNHIIESQTINSFPNIRSNLGKLAFSYQIAEVVNRILPENEAYPKIFYLLNRTFENINNSDNPKVNFFCQKFILETLWELGYLPKSVVMTGKKLQIFLENVMEKNLKSDSLLTRVTD